MDIVIPKDKQKQVISLHGIPEMLGSIDKDILNFSSYIDVAEKFLNKFPVRKNRNVKQCKEVENVHLLTRQLRTSFIQAHSKWIYKELLENYKGYKSLEEIVFEVSELVPGLVPTKTQMDAERTCLQSEKEGREVDQGIFFAGILNDAESGVQLIKKMLMPTPRAKNLLPRFQQDKFLQFKTLHLEITKGIAYITFQNSRYLNAEDDQLIDDMETAVDIVLLCDDAYAGVLRGGKMTHPRYTGQRVFSSGVNLKYLHLGKISFVNFLLRREFGYINKMLRGLILPDKLGLKQLKVIEKPWLSAVDHFAIGGGAQLLLVSDMVVASSDSYACLPAAKEGIVPGVANLRLARSTGGRLAKQIILHGRKVWANELEAGCFFDLIVEPSEMDAAIERCVQSLIAPAVIANRRMLTLANEPLDRFREYMAEFSIQQAIRLYSKDVLDKVEKQ